MLYVLRRVNCCAYCTRDMLAFTELCSMIGVSKRVILKQDVSRQKRKACQAIQTVYIPKCLLKKVLFRLSLLTAYKNNILLNPKIITEVNLMA